MSAGEICSDWCREAHRDSDDVQHISEARAVPLARHPYMVLGELEHYPVLVELAMMPYEQEPLIDLVSTEAAATSVLTLDEAESLARVLTELVKDGRRTELAGTEAGR